MVARSAGGLDTDLGGPGVGVDFAAEWADLVEGAVAARARRDGRRRALAIALWRWLAPLLLTFAGTASLVAAAFTVSVTVGLVGLGVALLTLDVLRHVGDGRGDSG
jgi:hypothetical protein